MNVCILVVEIGSCWSVEFARFLMDDLQSRVGELNQRPIISPTRCKRQNKIRNIRLRVWIDLKYPDMSNEIRRKPFDNVTCPSQSNWSTEIQELCTLILRLAKKRGKITERRGKHANDSIQGVWKMITLSELMTIPFVGLILNDKYTLKHGQQGLWLIYCLGQHWLFTVGFVVMAWLTLRMDNGPNWRVWNYRMLQKRVVSYLRPSNDFLSSSSSLLNYYEEPLKLYCSSLIKFKQVPRHNCHFFKISKNYGTGYGN